MKRIAKLVFLVWTLFCLGGLTRSLMHTVPMYRAAAENDEREAAQIAVVIGAAVWVGVWGVVALPSGLAWLTASDAGKKQY
jgi:hypothetical protein